MVKKKSKERGEERKEKKKKKKRKGKNRCVSNDCHTTIFVGIILWCLLADINPLSQTLSLSFSSSSSDRYSRSDSAEKRVVDLMQQPNTRAS